MGLAASLGVHPFATFFAISQPGFACNLFLRWKRNIEKKPSWSFLLLSDFLLLYWCSVLKNKMLIYVNHHTFFQLFLTLSLVNFLGSYFLDCLLYLVHLTSMWLVCRSILIDVASGFYKGKAQTLHYITFSKPAIHPFNLSGCHKNHWYFLCLFWQFEMLIPREDKIKF